MKYKLVFPAILIAAFSLPAQAQIKIKDITGIVSGNNSLSNDDIIKGLKEALSVGTNNSTASASKLDGYYKNPLIKIPFPKEAKDVKSTVESLGMKKQVDQFVMTLNRAAEDAAKKAAPIFLDAITHMTINDGVNILKGSDDAATQYLKTNTNSALAAEFKPIIKQSLQKVEITKYWNPLMKTYNKMPFVKRVNPNLDDYVTQKAIEGLFTLIAQEESKIRKDPAARVNDILKKVFGR